MWKNYLQGNGNFKYLGFLAIAGFLILVIAWINYVNLATARALDRSKEIGIRKVLGANVGQIVSLVTSEYFRLILIAGVVALPLAYVLMQQWLKSYVFRIQVGWCFFVLPILGVVLIAGLTVG